MDFSDYKAAPEVLNKLKNVDFIAVVGPSAVGKSSLMIAAAKKDASLTNVLTQTSRTLRSNERDGVDIHGRTREEMLKRIAEHEYVQVAPSLLGDIYATAPEDYPEAGVGMLAVLADAVAIFRALPFKSFKVLFVVPPDLGEWQKRLDTHGFTPKTLQKRLAEAKRSYQYALDNADTHFVINDQLEQATDDFIAIARGDELSPRQVADQQRARDIIQEILPHI